MAQKKYLDQNGLSHLWEKIKGYVNDRFSVIGQAHGRVASFSDGAEDKPLKALTVGIEPVQAGSGDPSPDNVRPITGRTGAKVTRTGKNLFDLDRTMGMPNPSTLLESPRIMDTSKWYKGLRADNYYYNGYANCTIENGVLTVYTFTNVNYGIGFPISCKPNTTYILSAEQTGCNFSVACYDKDWNFLSRLLGTTTYVSPLSFTTPSNAEYITVVIGSVVNGEGTATNIQLELGSTATAYEPYQGETYDIAFPSEAGTVYGGTLDVTRGVLTVDRAMDTKKWSEFQAKTSLENYTRGYMSLSNIAVDVNPTDICNVAPFKYSWTSDDLHFYVNGPNARAYLWLPNDTDGNLDVSVCYKLATPVTYQLTPTEIKTLLGANTVWADTGDILELQYVRSSSGDIEYIVSQSDAGTVNGHTVQSDVPANSAFTDTTYTLSQDVLDGHKITLTPSVGNPATITIPDNDTTYSPATSSSNGLMSAADKEKLDEMSCTRVYDDTLEYKTQSGWSPVDITLQPFTAVAEASVEWELGAISSSSGANSNSSTRLRTVSYLPTDIVSITPESGYRFVLMAYDDGTYIGAWNGTSYAKSATWLTDKVEASDLGQHDFRIVFARNPDSGTMTVDEKSNIAIVYNARMTVNDLAKRTISLEKALMGIDLSDPESAIYALALRVAQLEAHAILDSGYPSESSS